MNVVVEAGVLSAKADVVSVKVSVEINFIAIINAPDISCFSTTSVISVGGNSISSITPESILLGVGAAA